jgi:hypothetical protein
MKNSIGLPGQSKTQNPKSKIEKAPAQTFELTPGVIVAKLSPQTQVDHGMRISDFELRAGDTRELGRCGEIRNPISKIPNH